MRHLRYFVLACSLFSAAAVLAWQTSLAGLGITENDLTGVLKNYFQSTRPGDIPGTYPFKPAIAQQWKAKGGAERAQLVRAVGPAVKRVVSTPAFEKLHTGWIKDQYHAVNHGIQVASAPARPKMDDMMSQAMVQMVDSFKQVPIEGLKMMFQSDLQSWSRARDEKKKRLYARAQEIQPLIASNPNEFRKQYGLLKSVEMGGPDSLAGLDAARISGQKAAAAGERENEQRAYNQYNLRSQLRERLGEFVKTARSVDYAAQTKPLRGKQVFVNPAYEQKSDAWKKLYRIGREPAMAAVTIAEQWLKEL